jgi:hypothetical protein
VTIKERLYKLEQKINLMLENHLPHMEDRVKRTEWLMYTIIVLMLGISFKMLFV